MPRIQAASVAEHRRLQRDALLDAARSLLSEGGTRQLTFPALAERTGLARSSVYEYFRSRGAVVEALCAVDFPRWAAEVEAAVAAAPTPAARLETYIRTQLELAGDQRHRAVVTIAAGELDNAAREQIRAAHGGLIDLIVEVLEDLGQSEPRLAAALLQGVVDAAVRRRSLGAENPGLVADRAVALALRGLGSAPEPMDAEPSEKRQAAP